LHRVALCFDARVYLMRAGIAARHSWAVAGCGQLGRVKWPEGRLECNYGTIMLDSGYAGSVTAARGTCLIGCDRLVFLDCDGRTRIFTVSLKRSSLFHASYWWRRVRTWSFWSMSSRWRYLETGRCLAPYNHNSSCSVEHDDAS
jgi:hypothetical protein